MSRYVAIGSVCWDDVPGELGRERRLGGSVLFAARVAADAGWAAQIVTSGTEELEVAVRAAVADIDVDVVVQRSATDTVMRFGEHAELGPEAVPTVADPVDASLVDRLTSAEVIHLAPIMGEVTPALVAQVAGAPFVGITPQGLLRSRDGDHRLVRLPDLDAWWAPSVHAAVLSEDEHALVARPEVLDQVALAVTRGEQGCWGVAGGVRTEVAGIELDHVSPVGTIGAGDVFAAALFVALASGATFPEALERANRRAADHVGGLA